MDIFTPQYYFDLEQYEHASLFAELSCVWDALKRLKQYLQSLPLGKIQTEIPEGVCLVNPEQIFIGEGTIIEPGCYIRGPCWIGKNSTVRFGAYIRGLCLTGDECVIGHDTEVKNAILFNQAQAAHFAYLGDTILGNRVNLGAGTKCANLKFAEDEIFVSALGEKYPTGLRKFGAIIGDESQIGCNVVTNPGTLIGKSCFCYPCMNIGGFIPEDSLVKSPVVPTIVSKVKERRAP